MNDKINKQINAMPGVLLYLQSTIGFEIKMHSQV
jgi:hypothetical protein